MDGDDRSRSNAKSRLIGIEEILGRGWFCIGSRTRTRQVGIILRGRDVDAVAQDLAVQNNTIGYHDDPDSLSMPGENIRGAICDNADAREKSLPRCRLRWPGRVSAHSR